MLNGLMFKSSIGHVEWDWSDKGDPSPKYKAYNYVWYIPNKSDFYIVSDLSQAEKQLVKDELWQSLQLEIEWTKARRKQHLANKKAGK